MLAAILVVRCRQDIRLHCKDSHKSSSQNLLRDAITVPVSGQHNRECLSSSSSDTVFERYTGHACRSGLSRDVLMIPIASSKLVFTAMGD